jgi:hypothetical protein
MYYNYSLLYHSRKRHPGYLVVGGYTGKTLANPKKEKKKKVLRALATEPPRKLKFPLLLSSSYIICTCVRSLSKLQYQVVMASGKDIGSSSKVTTNNNNNPIIVIINKNQSEE